MRLPWLARTAAALTLLLSVLPVSAQGQDRGKGSSCIACHSGLEAALSEPVGKWTGSIHERNGITCASCHGGDPSDPGMEAMSPEKGFRGVPKDAKIPELCARCHPGVAEDYLDSAHGQALGRGGPQCVTCHGAHAIAEATPELINLDRCTACHGYGRADEIKSALASTDALISRIDGRIRGFHRIGYNTTDMEARLFQVRNAFHRLFHTVDVGRIRTGTAAFEEPLSELDRRLEEMRRTQAQRRLQGAVVVGLFALLTVLLALLRLTYRPEERKNDR